MRTPLCFLLASALLVSAASVPFPKGGSSDSGNILLLKRAGTPPPGNGKHGKPAWIRIPNLPDAVRSSSKPPTTHEPSRPEAAKGLKPITVHISQQTVDILNGKDHPTPEMKFDALHHAYQRGEISRMELAVGLIGTVKHYRLSRDWVDYWRKIAPSKGIGNHFVEGDWDTIKDHVAEGTTIEVVKPPLWTP